MLTTQNKHTHRKNFFFNGGQRVNTKFRFDIYRFEIYFFFLQNSSRNDKFFFLFYKTIFSLIKRKSFFQKWKFLNRTKQKKKNERKQKFSHGETRWRPFSKTFNCEKYPVTLLIKKNLPNFETIRGETNNKRNDNDNNNNNWNLFIYLKKKKIFLTSKNLNDRHTMDETHVILLKIPGRSIFFFSLRRVLFGDKFEVKDCLTVTILVLNQTKDFFIWRFIVPPIFLPHTMKLKKYWKVTLTNLVNSKGR